MIDTVICDLSNDRIRDIDREEVRFTYKQHRADPAHVLALT